MLKGWVCRLVFLLYYGRVYRVRWVEPIYEAIRYNRLNLGSGDPGSVASEIVILILFVLLKFPTKRAAIRLSCATLFSLRLYRGLVPAPPPLI